MTDDSAALGRHTSLQQGFMTACRTESRGGALMAGRTRSLGRSGLHRTADGRTRLGVLLVVLGVLSTGMLTLNGSASAAVTSVKGSACSYYVNVGLFGGPQTLLGCGQAAGASTGAKAASVTLAPDGSNSPQTATAPGAKAQ